LYLQDLRGRLGLLTEHLRKFSDLKTVADVVEDKDRINDQLVQNLVAAVGRRNDRLEACHERFVVLQNIVSEVDNLRVKAEEEKRKMEEKHKQGTFTGEICGFTCCSNVVHGTLANCLQQDFHGGSLGTRRERQRDSRGIFQLGLVFFSQIWKSCIRKQPWTQSNIETGCCSTK
jgi:hypothetical protein